MIEKKLLDALKPYRKKRLVLGFSGGADSMALFKALVAIRQPFVAAHVDHGWRDSSRLEAENLHKIACEHNIPFYLKTLKISEYKGNLEASARRFRLNFFKEVLEKTSSTAVLLAHHADDLAETTLKKLFEGAFLPNLGSMTKAVEIEGVLVLRPFLCFAKEELLNYLGKNFYVDDTTNLSPRFLRGRLRSTLIPYLSKTFGKNVSSAFVSLSDEALELKGFLAEALKAYAPKKDQGKAVYDLTSAPHPYLLKKVVENAFREAEIPVRKKEIHALSEAILEKRKGFQRTIGHKTLIADGGKLIAPLNPHVLN
ncbi:MAG: tRNA lysidine(34) synthetase TilS [Chlamydiia bacterium]|nr:tRNA lysidine(34) synthetase TilS [Chlamydiia bacterium]